MHTLNRYIFRNLLGTTLMALGILSFVMLSGQLFRAFDLVIRGVSPLFLVKFLACLMPDMLRFTLPLSLLVATVLVFSRLSADSEVVAMKAMGISLWQIITPAFLLSLLFAALCLYLSLFAAPESRNRAAMLRLQALAETPLAMVEPGVFSEIMPGCLLRVGRRNGDALEDIHIVYTGADNKEMRDVIAQKGRVIVNAEEGILELALEDAKLVFTSLQKERPTQENTCFLEAHSIRVPLNYGNTGKSKLRQKLKYLNLKTLCARYVLDKEAGRPVSEHLTALHQRLAMAISPISFLLIGLTFGIRSKRSELSVGLLICVLLAVGFYAFLMLANAVEDIAWLHPQYILWIPNLLYQGTGLMMMRKLEQRG